MKDNVMKRLSDIPSALGIINIPVEDLMDRYGTADDKYLDYDGIRIRYRDEGKKKGPVVVLLHGVCAFLETWDGWASVLKKHCRVIRLDIPGFGLTGPAPDKSYYARDKLVRVMDDLIVGLGIKKFAIAGNSLGGYIAWNYALDHPEKVTRLILVDPVGYNQKMPFLLTFASHPLVRPYARVAMPRFILYAAVRQVYGDKSKVTRKLQQHYFEYAMRKGNKGSYVDIFTEMKRQNRIPSLPREIPRIKTPTLVMWGTKDEWIPFKYFESWKRDLPSATFIAYEGLGHVSMEEIPEKTVADALKFLKMK